LGSVVAPTAFGSIAMRVSSSVRVSLDGMGAAQPFHHSPDAVGEVRPHPRFSAPNPGKRITPGPSAGQAIDMRNRTRTVIWKAAAALAAVITVGACSGSPQVRSITLTFIRHAESQSNAQHVINTDIPGPSLSEQGEGQAEQLAHQLSRNNFDAIYASDMVRTQQTAAPLAHALGKSVEILPGLREIEAGRYNNTTTKRADLTYLVAPADWLNGDVKDAIPGSISGEQFNDRFTAAVQKIYDSGHNKPVAFSHAESIMYWTLMNVKNPKDSLATSHPLPNLGRVVITGSPALGWTLVDWDGIRDFSY
jgi:broad specificity phosphatase PhoE